MAFAGAFYIHGLEGMENTKALTEQFNGMLFGYDIHDVFFKITKQGFERIEGIQEVKA
ncbi:MULTISPECIES: enterotoxin [Bacillus cereus group]|uniref:enterotoxin n=1 Tax=Bacillus cereus group TaxID=86661 RepID=UPI001CD1EA14|nr:enterotoxin [Bacillus toyonensis]MCA1046167.1 enterotoxin [Bacillus toyonensis]MED3197157.1 enterotoxin [Bacillus toyonensis]